MTRRTRRFLLVFLIFLFLLTAPAMLFYAWGYSFDWQKKKPVITGGLYLKSIPKKAEIYINNKPKDTTPRLIKRLIPKEYQIKIAKDSYHPWQKKLKVESKLVTEVRNILLIPENPTVELVKDNLNENFSLEEFFLTDEVRNRVSHKLVGNSVSAGYKIIGQNIFYIQKPSYILYQTDLTGALQEQISLSPLAEDNYQIIVSSHQQLAVLSSQGKLFLFKPKEKIFECLAENIKGVQFSDDYKKLLYFSQSEIWVYYLEDILIQPNKKTGQKELITRLSQEIKQAIWYGETNEHIIFTVGQFVKIIELDDRDIRNTVDFLEAETSQIAYDKKTEKLYFVEGEKLFGVSLK